MEAGGDEGDRGVGGCGDDGGVRANPGAPSGSLSGADAFFLPKRLSRKLMGTSWEDELCCINSLKIYRFSEIKFHKARGRHTVKHSAKSE